MLVDGLPANLMLTRKKSQIKMNMKVATFAILKE